MRQCYSDVALDTSNLIRVPSEEQLEFGEHISFGIIASAFGAEVGSVFD
jgi:hypothetical protein